MEPDCCRDDVLDGETWGLSKKVSLVQRALCVGPPLLLCNKTNLFLCLINIMEEKREPAEGMAVNRVVFFLFLKV